MPKSMINLRLPRDRVIFAFCNSLIWTFKNPGPGATASISTRSKSPPRFSAFFSLAWSTRILRMASAAAPRSEHDFETVIVARVSPGFMNKRGWLQCMTGRLLCHLISRQPS